MPFYHPVPEKLLTQIGNMIVSFAALELHLQLIFGTLLHQPARIDQILACQLPFSRLTTYS
jgi:hypothetical protein